MGVYLFSVTVEKCFVYKLLCVYTFVVKTSRQLMQLDFAQCNVPISKKVINLEEIMKQVSEEIDT